MKAAPRIYNLFPRLAGPMDRWLPWFDHAADLMFDWVYINPFHYPGFSGSLYAVKDYWKLNPMFLPGDAWPQRENELDHLKRLVDEARSRGLKLMMDLVINHTAKDSVLVPKHPDWYVRDADGEVVSPSAIDPADARKVTVWGDLADIDNAASSDKTQLWQYWEDLVDFYVSIGFEGFRCDAAYQVPSGLWRRLIGKARSINPACLFWAETLGCRLEEIVDLENAGFDLIANSSKWWDFSEPWCLKQHEQFRALGPSVGFPESHDTERLAEETGGLAHVQKQRFLFASVFSAGVLMPMGYEYGFRRRLNVVKTRPEDMEPHHFDISGFIRETNRLKATLPILQSDGVFEAMWGLEGPVLCLKKTEAEHAMLILINKDWVDSQPASIQALAQLTGAREHFLLLSQQGRQPLGPAFKKTLNAGEILLIQAGNVLASSECS